MENFTTINAKVKIMDDPTASKARLMYFDLLENDKDYALIADTLYHMNIALATYVDEEENAYYITSFDRFRNAIKRRLPIGVYYPAIIDVIRRIKGELTVRGLQKFTDFVLNSMPETAKNHFVHMDKTTLKSLYDEFVKKENDANPGYARFKRFVSDAMDADIDCFVSFTPEQVEYMYDLCMTYKDILEKEKASGAEPAPKTEESCVIPEDVDREFIIRDLLKMNALLTAKDNEGETFFITDNALAIEAIRNRYQVSVRCPRLVEVVRGIRKKGADMVHFSMFVRKALKGRFVDLTAGELESLYNEFTKEVKASDAEPVTKDKDETCENVDRCRLRRAIIRIPEDRRYGVGVPINRDGRVLCRSAVVRIKAPSDKYHAIPKGYEDHAAIVETLFRMKITLVVNPGKAGNDYYITSANELRMAIDKGYLIGVRYPGTINTVRRIRSELTEDKLLLFTDFVLDHRKAFVDMSECVLESYYNRFVKEVKTSEAKPDPKTEDPCVIPEDEERADTARALFCMNILLMARTGDGRPYYITDSSLLENAIAEHHQIIIRDPYLLAKVREISTEMTDVEMMDLGKFISRKMKNYGFNDLTVEALGFLYNEFKKQ